MQYYVHQLQWFNIVEDCLVFDGLFEFCQLGTLDSMGGAAQFMSPLERKVSMGPNHNGTHFVVALICIDDIRYFKILLTSFLGSFCLLHCFGVDMMNQ